MAVHVTIAVTVTATVTARATARAIARATATWGRKLSDTQTGSRRQNIQEKTEQDTAGEDWLDQRTPSKRRTCATD